MIQSPLNFSLIEEEYSSTIMVRMNYHKINRDTRNATLRLLINDTARNNQTEIYCDGVDESFQTTLFVVGMYVIMKNQSAMHIL